MLLCTVTIVFAPTGVIAWPQAQRIPIDDRLYAAVPEVCAAGNPKTYDLVAFVTPGQPFMRLPDTLPP